MVLRRVTSLVRSPACDGKMPGRRGGRSFHGRGDPASGDVWDRKLRWKFREYLSATLMPASSSIEAPALAVKCGVSVAAHTELTTVRELR